LKVAPDASVWLAARLPAERDHAKPMAAVRTPDEWIGEMG